jgi:hypothetical protein
MGDSPDPAAYGDNLNLPRPIRAAVERCRCAMHGLEFEDKRAVTAVLLGDFLNEERSRSPEGAAGRPH